jgi:transposase
MITSEQLIAVKWSAGEDSTRYENTYLFTQEEFSALAEGELEARQQAEYDAWIATMDEMIGNTKWRLVTG